MSRPDIISDIIEMHAHVILVPQEAESFWVMLLYSGLDPAHLDCVHHL